MWFIEGLDSGIEIWSMCGCLGQGRWWCYGREGEMVLLGIE
jgi:hypothetical protein